MTSDSPDKKALKSRLTKLTISDSDNAKDPSVEHLKNILKRNNLEINHEYEVNIISSRKTHFFEHYQRVSF